MKTNENKITQLVTDIDEAKKIALDAYVYGYPLVTMEMTRQLMTNVESPSFKYAQMGQFAKLREYPGPNDKEVTAPNADTLYTLAWLDLSKEPFILKVPDFKDRYFMLPMLSAWTNVFAVPGTRTTGTDATTYAITGPDFSGKLPAHVEEIKAPTNIVWILGRIYCDGSPSDIAEVHSLQDRLNLTPLSSFGHTYNAPSGNLNPSMDMHTPVREQVHALDIETFFTMMAKLMVSNPAAKEDAPFITKMIKIGLIPGEEFDLNSFDDEIINALKEIPKIAQRQIFGYLKDATQLINGWSVTSQTGVYGTNYLLRALVTAVGLGANKPEDAVYPVGKVDKDGKPLSGENKYIIHFDKDNMPPVQGFWSLTMYDSEYYFVPNKLNRYTLSSRFDFEYNADGSLDLLIQNESPGKEKERNWLPAPKGDFVLMLRFYWPDKAIINNKWQIPAIEKQS